MTTPIHRQPQRNRPLNKVAMIPHTYPAWVVPLSLGSMSPRLIRSRSLAPICQAMIPRIRLIGRQKSRKARPIIPTLSIWLALPGREAGGGQGAAVCHGVGGAARRMQSRQEAEGSISAQDRHWNRLRSVGYWHTWQEVSLEMAWTPQAGHSR